MQRPHPSLHNGTTYTYIHIKLSDFLKGITNFIGKKKSLLSLPFGCFTIQLRVHANMPMFVYINKKKNKVGSRIRKKKNNNTLLFENRKPILKQSPPDENTFCKHCLYF